MTRHIDVSLMPACHLPSVPGHVCAAHIIGRGITQDITGTNRGTYVALSRPAATSGAASPHLTLLIL